MRKSNTEIFREIARRCTIDVAISLSGRELTNGRGNVVNDAKIGKAYRSLFGQIKTQVFHSTMGKVDVFDGRILGKANPVT